MINTQYINLNMTPGGVLPVLHCSQYDIGRPLGLVVYNGSEAVDLSAYTATIEATRTDGTAITTTVASDGTFTTTATMTNKADRYFAQLVLVQNGQRVASLPFVMCVVPAAMDENSEAIQEDASLFSQFSTSMQSSLAALTAESAANSARIDNMIALQTEGSMQGSKITTFVAQSAAQFTSSGDWQSFSFCDYSLHLNTTPAMSVFDGLSNPVLLSAGAYVLASQSASITDEPVYVNLTDDVRFYNHGYLGSDPDKRAVEINMPKITDAAGNISGMWLLFTFSVVSDVPVDLSELTDIRIGADGATYSTAGDAVRGQYGAVKSDIANKTLAEYDPMAIGTLHGGRYILTTTGLSSVSANWSYTDFLAVGDAKAYLLTCPTHSNSISQQYVAAVAYYTTNATDGFISAEPIRAGSDGGSTWIVTNVPPTARYIRLSVWTASASGYQIVPISKYYDTHDDVTEITGYKRINLTYTAASQIKATDLDVKAGVTYRIKVINHYSDSYADRLNVFSNGTGGSANYVVYNPYDDYCDFVCTVDGKLTFYNTGGYVGSVSFDVFWNLSRVVEDDPIVYRVDPSGDHASLTALLLDLKDDTRPKIIKIAGGDYDIFAEYKALQNAGRLPTVPTSGFDPSTGYVPYNVFIPDNTHIIGEGVVKLNYLPSASDTFANEASTLSPINVAGSMILENVEIYQKNGRYCIHDDPISDPKYNGAHKVYKNVKCVKYVADIVDGNALGSSYAFGCGISRAMSYEFDNCYFETKSTYSGSRTFYFHDRAVVGGVTLQDKMSSRITVKDTVVINGAANLAFFFGNIGAGFNHDGLNIRVDIDNCWTNGNIVSADESNASTGNQPNSYAFKIVKSTYNDLIIRYANNRHTPQVYA